MVKDHDIGDSWIAVALRVLVAALAALAATWQAATSVGIAAAAAGAALGVIAGEVLSRSRVRLLLAVLGGFAVIGLGFLSSWLLTRWEILATRLGPGVAVVVSDSVLLACLTLGICTILRSTGARWRPAAAFEVVVLAAGLASPLAAHRGGSINRPLDLGDRALAAGEDPVIYLQLLGGVAAVGLALFLITERRWLRAIAAAVLVLFAAVAMGVVGSMIQPPPSRAAEGLGLTGQGEREGQGGNKSRSLDQMDFRDNYGGKQRAAPVAVVLLHDDYSPPSGTFYFRQNAFSRYNGRRMVPAMHDGAEIDLFQYFPAQERAARWVPPPEGRIPVKTTVAFIQDHVAPVILEAPATVGPAKNPAPRRFRRVYKASSLAFDTEIFAMLGSKVGDPSWAPELRESYVVAPEDERYLVLANEIIETIPQELRADPVAQAFTITRYLSKHGVYSLRSQHAAAADPTSSFLFGDLTGYCVYFAHAAVFLFRSLGIPSRVATGYAYPASERGRGSALMLRGSDAHAWPEVFIEGSGWVVMDVTPARNLEQAGPPLDSDLQRLLGEMLRGQLDEQRRATVALGQTPVGLRDALHAAGALGQGLAVLAVVLLILLYLGKIYRRLAPSLLRESQRTRVSYRAALDHLSDVGLRREHGEPPIRFAERVRDTAPSLTELAAAAVARKLGSRRLDDPARSGELSRMVKREVRGAIPWWRRMLGVLDPIAWVRVR